MNDGKGGNYEPTAHFTDEHLGPTLRISCEALEQGAPLTSEQPAARKYAVALDRAHCNSEHIGDPDTW